MSFCLKILLPKLVYKALTQCLSSVHDISRDVIITSLPVNDMKAKEEHFAFFVSQN